MPSLVQLHPNRLTITPERVIKAYKWEKFYLGNGMYGKLKSIKRIENFRKVKNPFIISQASKRKMMDSINAMYALSPKREITMQTGKKIYNYKMSFITLTLPSKQAHSDQEIKSECLNQFLVEIRKHYGIDNYVWKAELQENQNVHFHLVVDKYIDYQALRRRWNRILDKLNYVKEYQKRMQSLSLSQYHEMRSRYGDVKFEDSAKAYAAGLKVAWRNPNSVDVRSVYGKKEFAIYMAKYMAKKMPRENISDTQLQRELSFGRSWNRSYTLARLKFNCKHSYEEMRDVIHYLKNEKNKVKRCIGDYFEAFYFNADELSASFKKYYKRIILSHAELYDYPIPGFT